jgi:hypothetical protein
MDQKTDSPLKNLLEATTQKFYFEADREPGIENGLKRNTADSLNAEKPGAGEEEEQSRELLELGLLRLKEPEYSEPSQGNLENIDRPVAYSVVRGRLEAGESALVSLHNAAKARDTDWRTCRLATDDLRVTQHLSTCLECFVPRPLAIFMPCGHGGCCLRCSVKKDNKQKMCPYCSKVVEFILEMGECCQEVFLESTDQEFHVFPILKVIRMVRNSMNNPITPLFGSWSETNSNISTNVAEQTEDGNSQITFEKSQSGEQIKKSVAIHIGKVSSPRSDSKVEGIPRKNSLTSIAMNSDQERSGSNKEVIPQKKSDTDSQDDTNQKSLSHSGVSTDIPNLVGPGFQIQVPSPQFRGSLHLKHVPFQFHIDETDSEDSFSEERPKSAKGSKESAQGSQGMEEHHPKSVTSSRSQYQSKLSLQSLDLPSHTLSPNQQQ